MVESQQRYMKNKTAILFYQNADDQNQNADDQNENADDEKQNSRMPYC